MSEEASKPTEQAKLNLNIKASHVAREWKHAAPLIGCRYDPTGRYAFATSMDFSIQRWDLQEDQHTSFAGHQSWLRGIGFSPDGQSMYSACYQGKLCFWQTTATPEEGKSVAPIREIDAHEGWVRWLAVHPDGKLIATAGNDLKIKLWSTETGELLQTLEGHQKHIYSLLFHPNGKLLLSGDLAGIVNQWELSSGEKQRSFDAKLLHTYHGGQRVDYGGVRCMALSTDGKLLACGGLHKATNPFAGVQEPLVLIFDWETGKQIRTHEATEIPRGIVWRLAFEPDGTLIGGVGGRGGTLVFWNEEKTDTHKFSMPNTVLDLDHHPSEFAVVTAHHDGFIRITQMTEKS